MKKSLENLLEKQGITLLNTLSKEERRARTETIKARYPSWRELVARAYPQLSCSYGSYLCEW